jgi:hypothetical protein
MIEIATIAARNGVAALALTPVLPEATSVGAFSAHLRRPRPRSATSTLRRFETSLKRLKCANSGHLLKATVAPEPVALEPRRATWAPLTGHCEFGYQANKLLRWANARAVSHSGRLRSHSAWERIRPMLLRWPTQRHPRYSRKLTGRPRASSPSARAWR